MGKKRKNKKQTKLIITAISFAIVLMLILVGANSDVINTVSNIAGLNITFENTTNNENTEKTKFVTDSNLKVYFIDVGQADSILVTNKDEAMLIDAGNNDDGKDVVKFIQEKGIQKLKYVVRNTST